MRELRRFRFRPGAWDRLEGRVVLSRGWRPPLAEVFAPIHRAPKPRAPIYRAPAAEINEQYDRFLADLQQVVQSTPDALASTSPTAAQVQTYVGLRAQSMAQSLVAYFNRLPIELPRAPGPYRTPRPRNAIQQYISNRLMGEDPSSLAQSLLSIPLPAGPGAGQALYLATAETVIESSRQEVLEGVRLLFAGEDVLGLGTDSPTIPAD